MAEDAGRAGEGAAGTGAAGAAEEDGLQFVRVSLRATRSRRLACYDEWPRAVLQMAEDDGTPTSPLSYDVGMHPRVESMRDVGVVQHMLTERVAMVRFWSAGEPSGRRLLLMRGEFEPAGDVLEMLNAGLPLRLRSEVTQPVFSVLAPERRPTDVVGLLDGDFDPDDGVLTLARGRRSFHALPCEVEPAPAASTRLAWPNQGMRAGDFVCFRSGLRQPQLGLGYVERVDRPGRVIGSGVTSSGVRVAFGRWRIEVAGDDVEPWPYQPRAGDAVRVTARAPDPRPSRAGAIWPQGVDGGTVGELVTVRLDGTVAIRFPGLGRQQDFHISEIGHHDPQCGASSPLPNRPSSCRCGIAGRRPPSPRPVPTSLECPITQLPIEDPVVAADGWTYERGAFERWAATRRASGLAVTSPLTGQELPAETYPNRALRQAREAQLEQHGRRQEEEVEDNEAEVEFEESEEEKEEEKEESGEEKEESEFEGPEPAEEDPFGAAEPQDQPQVK